MSASSVSSSPLPPNRSVIHYLEVKQDRDRFHGVVDQKIYKDVFLKLAEFFSQKELAILPEVSKAFHSYTAAKRAATPELDLARTVGRVFIKHALETSLAQYSTVVDLNLNNYMVSSFESVITLLLAFRGRKIVNLNMGNFYADYNSPNSFPNWACRLIYGLDLSAAQRLDFKGISTAACEGFLPLLISLMDKLTAIKSIELDEQMFSKDWSSAPDDEEISADDFKKNAAKSYLLSLRPDIENLSLPVNLDEEQIDLIVSRFSPATIKSCNLTTNAGLNKKLELLRFLPLSEMTHIELTGFAHTLPLFQYLTAKLALNTVLHTLKFGEDFNKELPKPHVLINCLHSEHLVNLHLCLLGHLDDTDLILKDQNFVTKLPFWPKIKEVVLENWNLLPDVKELQHLSQGFTLQELQAYIPELPLATQRHVALRADFTLENFADIAQKLAQNEQLETLFLAGFGEQITVPMLTELIGSLRAPDLTELYLFPDYEIDFASLKPVLQQALAGNMGMKQLQIGTRVNRLAELHQAPPAARVKGIDE